jgi:type VI secretion system secreted protein VgrG
MTTYSQERQAIALATPLGPDAALLARLHGTEALSDLFHFTLDLLAPRPLRFDRLLGQPATVRLNAPGCPRRFVNGILVSLEEGHTVPGPLGGVTFYRYRAELAPRLWLLGQRKQSRVFQSVSAPDIVLPILKEEWQIDVQSLLTGTYPARDYCVQYRETDLAFVRRLMEEEGICFYFRHEESRHTLVLADGPGGHADLDGQSTLLFDAAAGGQRPEGRVEAWGKRQTLRACKYQLRDYCFQLSQSTVDSTTRIADKVRVGQVEHLLAIDPAQRSEIYEHPGGYGWRFDGVSPDGANHPDNVQHLFKDNDRLSHLRMQEEAAAAVVARGESRCGHLLPGYTFTLASHRDGDGAYLLTRVEHDADVEDAYLSESVALGAERPQVPGDERLYRNRFEAIPAEVPFRPPRVTPRPTIPGPQTAVVVGPKGNDVFVDRYGRVKVKFYWDRDPSTGPHNSCWLRVAQVWAGNRWGAYFWPRVGHEVVVAFNEGNPDRPMIVGSVYNENNMPPFALPENRLLGGVKSFTATGDVNAPADPLANFNGIVFNDAKGKEQIELHGERHIAFFGEHSHRHSIDGSHHLNVNGVHRVHVGELPLGSGSGGGFDNAADDDYVTPAFTYNGTVGHGKIGVSLSTVTGLSQAVVLGGSTFLVVGQEFNILVNPVGLALDLGSGFDAVDSASGKALSVIGPSLAGITGDIDLYMGTYAFAVYGRNINVNRSSRTAVNTELTWLEEREDPNNQGQMLAAQPWALVGQILAELVALELTGATIYAAIDAYKDTTLDDSLIGGGELAGEILASIDILIGMLLHIDKLTETSLATAVTDAWQSLKDGASSVLQLVACASG